MQNRISLERLLFVAITPESYKSQDTCINNDV